MKLHKAAIFVLIVLVSAACTSNGLSVEEYAEWCGGLDTASVISAVDLDGTWSDAVTSLDDLIEKYQGIDPPEALARYHSASLDFWQGIRSFVETLEPSSDAQPLDLLGTVLLLTPPFMAAENSLSQDVRAMLEEAGCVSGESDQADATPTPMSAAVGDVIPMGRFDTVVKGIERNAIRVEDVWVSRVEIEFTNARGAIERISYSQVRGIDAEGQHVEPYDVCHRNVGLGPTSPCSNPMGHEDFTPAEEIRRYVYFVESPAYPLAFIQLAQLTGPNSSEGGGWVEWVEPRVALPAP